MKLKLTQILPDKDQPRAYFDTKKIEELMDSIKKNGLLSPLVVEKTDDPDKFLIIDGERRYRSLTKLGIKTCDVLVLDKMTQIERTIKRFHLHEQSSHWTIMEKGKAIIVLRDELKINDTNLRKLLSLGVTPYKTYILAGSLDENVQEYIAEINFPQACLIETVRILENTYPNSKDKLKPFLKIVKDKKTTTRKVLGDIRKCSQRSENKKYVRKFVTDKDYTYQNLMEDTELYNTDLVEMVNGRVSRLLLQLQRVMDNNLVVDYEKLDQLRCMTKKYLDSSGYDHKS